MKPRTLILLTLLVAGLGGFVYFVERDLPSTNERLERANRVLSLAAEDVQAIEIEAEGERVRLVRDGDERWSIEKPFEGAAEAPEAEALLRDLAALEKQRTIEGDDPSELGILPPEVAIGITSKSGQTQRLLVGPEVPASDRRVAAVEGRGEAYVIDSGFLARVLRPALDWRSRDVFPLLQNEIAAIALEPDWGEPVRLLRSGEAWRLEPLGDEADARLVQGLMTKLVGLRAEGFLDDADWAEVRGPEQIAVRVESQSGSVTELIWSPPPLEDEETGEATSTAIGLWEDKIFQPSEDLAPAFFRRPDEWRSRAWTTMKSFEVDAVSIEDDVGSLVLAREGTNWVRDGEVIPSRAVSDLLYAITAAEAESVEAGGAELSDPILRVSLTSEDGEAEELSLAWSEDGRLRGRRGGRTVLFWMPEGLAGELDQLVEEARQAEPEVEPLQSEGSAEDSE